MRTTFYSPAPYPANEEQRQEVVTRLLSCDFSVPRLQEIVNEVAQLFGVSIGAVTLLDQDRQWLAVRTGLAAAATPRAVAFCGHTIDQHEPLCVPDARQDNRFAGNPLVVGDLNIRFYAGARLVVEGLPAGALCAIGAKVSEPPTAEHLARLEALATEAASLLEQQLASSAHTPPSPDITSKVIAIKSGSRAHV